MFLADALKAEGWGLVGWVVCSSRLLLLGILSSNPLRASSVSWADRRGVKIALQVGYC
jgi:hypothetical protein